MERAGASGDATACKVNISDLGVCPIYCGEESLTFVGAHTRTLTQQRANGARLRLPSKSRLLLLLLGMQDCQPTNSMVHSVSVKLVVGGAQRQIEWDGRTTPDRTTDRYEVNTSVWQKAVAIPKNRMLGPVCFRIIYLRTNSSERYPLNCQSW